MFRKQKVFGKSSNFYNKRFFLEYLNTKKRIETDFCCSVNFLKFSLFLIEFSLMFRKVKIHFKNNFLKILIETKMLSETSIKVDDQSKSSILKRVMTDTNNIFKKTNSIP